MSENKTEQSAFHSPHCPVCGFKWEGTSFTYLGLTFHHFGDNKLSSVYDKSGAALPFTASESLLLSTLATARGRIVPKQLIYEASYPVECETNPKVLDVRVCKLRKKLKALNIGVEIISEWGRGYRLSGQAVEQAA